MTRSRPPPRAFMVSLLLPPESSSTPSPPVMSSNGSPTRDPMGYEFLPWPSIERVGAEG
ncbi:MAG: hypothetical protein M3522_04815 [Actinomycetota bacterium]|nr:hypothetical protein [Actinomycetota bacterium]